MTDCVVCGTGCGEVKLGLFDDRYGYPGFFDLAQCPACGHAMTFPGLREEDLPALYGSYYPRRSVDIPGLAAQVGRPASWRARFRRWFEGTGNQGHYLTQPGMKVLDYGCGAAVSLLEIQALGGEAYGIEADPNVAAIAAHYGLKIHIGRIEDEPFPGVRFDLIVLNQVIEHLPDPARLIGRLLPRLAPGGRIVLSFPNAASLNRHLSGKRWINWHVPYHLQHFCASSFRVLAARCGLEILSYRTITPNLWTVLQWRSRGQISTPGVASAVWSGDAASPATTPASAQRRSLARRALGFVVRNVLRVGAALLRRANSILLATLNRCVDSAGYGDSILVVLRPQSGGR